MASNRCPGLSSRMLPKRLCRYDSVMTREVILDLPVGPQIIARVFVSGRREESQGRVEGATTPALKRKGARAKEKKWLPEDRKVKE